MELFCNDREWAEKQRRLGRMNLAFRILAGLTPAAFVGICLMIRTGNAPVMHGVLLAVTGVLGGAALVLYVLGVRPAKAAVRHMEMLRSREKEMLNGILQVSNRSVQIPSSVRVRPVRLDTGEERETLLNIDEEWVARLPANGSRVRIAAAAGFIAGLETAIAAEGAWPIGENGTAEPAIAAEGAGSAGKNGLTGENRHAEPTFRRVRRKIGIVFPMMVIWVFAVVIFGSFVFYRVTDTDAGHKITLFVDGTVRQGEKLAARLEEGMEAPIRMVQVHPFSYMMFGGEELKAADLFIVPASETEQFMDWFAPVPEELREWPEMLEAEGIPMGILVYAPGKCLSVACDVIDYEADGKGNEKWYLFFGKESRHMEDGYAVRTAKMILGIEK